MTIVVTVNANATGTITNTASVSGDETDPVGANDDSTATTPVTTQSDLAVTKTDSPDPVVAGSNVTYSMTVVNNGPSTANNVTLTDTLPSGVTFVSAVPGQGSCGGTSTVTCDLGSLASGASTTVTIVATVNASSGTLSNTASVSADETDPQSSNDSATAGTAVTVVEADLSLTKTDSTDPVTTAGATLTYTLVVTNSGPDTATNVVLTDTLPSGVTLVSADSDLGSYSGTSIVTCNLCTMDTVETSASTITIVITLGPLFQGILTNTATVTATQTDPDTGDNSVTETTPVNNPDVIPGLSAWGLLVLSRMSPRPSYGG